MKILALNGNNLGFEKTFCNNLATPHDLPEPLFPNIAIWLLNKSLISTLILFPSYKGLSPKTKVDGVSSPTNIPTSSGVIRRREALKVGLRMTPPINLPFVISPRNLILVISSLMSSTSPKTFLSPSSKTTCIFIILVFNPPSAAILT